VTFALPLGGSGKHLGSSMGIFPQLDKCDVDTVFSSAKTSAFCFSLLCYKHQSIHHSLIYQYI
jgi:hypothetical protein